jgi:hypothetical protein
MQEDVLLSVMSEQRISESNGLPAKKILKAAVAADREKIKKVWIKLTISIISVRCIKKHICKLHSQRRQLLQANAKKRQTDVFKWTRSNVKKNCLIIET